VIGDAGLAQYSFSDPEQLPARLRSPAWHSLVSQLDAFDRLGVQRQFIVLSVLCRLGLFDAAQPVAQAILGRDQPTQDAEQATLAAAYVEQKLGDDAASTQLLTSLVEASDNARVRTIATVTMLVAAAKARPTRLDDVYALAARAEAEKARLDEVGSDAASLAFESWYLRGMSFVPFFRRDLAATAELLDAAESVAERIPQSTPRDALAATETLLPLYETRIKVKIALEDHAGACAYAGRLIRLDPYNPKHHIQLGHLHFAADDLDAAEAAYGRAFETGSPCTAVASFFVGCVHERRGDPTRAAAAYVASLLRDEGAVSPARHLLRLGTSHAVDASDVEHARSRLATARAVLTARRSEGRA